jgi:glucose/arabinose dehydrogenase
MNANLPTRDTRDVIRAGVQYCARYFTAAVVLCTWVLAGCGELPEDVEGQGFAIVPSQFTDSLVASIGRPTDLAFTPDGRLLVTTQGGDLRVIVGGNLLPTAALNLSSRMCTESERGLLGIAVDPQFVQNGHVYLFYTFKRSNHCENHREVTGPVNRVSRFTYDRSRNTIDIASEFVLLDDMLSLGGNHNGGDLAIGRDGMLYISSGDSGCQLPDPNDMNRRPCAGGNKNARFTGNLSGKILRINRDGTIPTSNPLFNAAGARSCGDPRDNQPGAIELGSTRPCREIFAYGLRNPFRFAFKPGTDTFFINDVGQDVWEEIDEGSIGANYGWNTREGFCQNNVRNNCSANPAGLTPPIFAYNRDDGCRSITGGAFVPNGAFGSSFDNAYMFADYACGRIFKLTRQTNGSWRREEFAHSLGGSSAVALQFGLSPNGERENLYYTTYANGGSVRRIEFTGDANRAPNAIIKGMPLFSTTIPHTVNFDGSASSDPDGDAIVKYIWNFGDGQSTETTGPTVSHTFNQAREFVVELKVRDARGRESAPATVKVATNNTPPMATITSPGSSARFAAGQVITLSATSSDAQETLGNQALRWTVELNHNDNHTHPLFGPAAGNGLTFTAPAPEGISATDLSYLAIKLEVTDSGGLTTEIRRRFDPRHVALDFRSEPPGVVFALNDVPGDEDTTTPFAITSWEGWGITAAAPPEVTLNGTRWFFSRWENGAGATRNITTPAAPTTYTAIYSQNAFSARINFQPAGSAVPENYVADTGLVFGARNGLSYGWNAATNETRDRNLNSDQRYDTLNHMQKPSNPNARWEIAVPNGSYRVRVVSGDPGHIDSVFHMLAENVQVFNATPTTAQRFADGTVTVNVTDGRLTLTNGASARNNKINFVEITPP